MACQRATSSNQDQPAAMTRAHGRKGFTSGMDKAALSRHSLINSLSKTSLSTAHWQPLFRVHPVVFVFTPDPINTTCIVWIMAGVAP